MEDKEISIARFEDLRPWKESRRLTRSVYQLVKSPGMARDPDLVSQIRRAAVSVMANIAEGFGSGSGAEFKRFLSYSARSLSEIQSHLYVALDQKYADSRAIEAIYKQASEIRVLIQEVEHEWSSEWGTRRIKV